MHLAIIHPFQFRYRRGIERYVWELADALCRRDPTLKIDLLTWGWPQPVTWQENARIHVRRVPGVRYFMARFASVVYGYWLWRHRYDQVVVFFAAYGEADAVRMARRLRRFRTSVVFHFPVEQVPHRYEEFRRSGLAQHADSLIAVSESVAAGVRDAFGRDCVVIPNGVNPNVFHNTPDQRRAARQRLGIGDDSPVLVTLAALEARKGVQHVIQALPALLGEYPDLSYWVLGDGDGRRDLMALAQSLDLTERVHFVGNTEDVVTYLAAADIGCLLSQGEAFPLTLLEYMAMELPVLTSGHPPFPDLVQADWGMMVDEGNASSVCDALRTLLNSAETRRRLGTAGRQRVLDQYAWEQVARRYLEHFNALQSS